MKIYYFDQFKQFPALVHGISTAELGNMSARYGPWEEVRTNRKLFLDALRVPEKNTVFAQLEHGVVIKEVGSHDHGRGITDPKESLLCDVMVTSKPDTYLFFLVADCLALFFFDPVKQVCALAHAGWRGVDKEVPRLTIEYLQKKHGSLPNDILVGFSPACQKESSCFPDQGQGLHPNWPKYREQQNGLYCFDWVQFAFDQLTQAGVPERNIERSTINTRTNNEFFSHRRNKEAKIPEARFGCSIGLRKTE